MVTIAMLEESPGLVLRNPKSKFGTKKSRIIFSSEGDEEEAVEIENYNVYFVSPKKILRSVSYEVLGLDEEYSSWSRFTQDMEKKIKKYLRDNPSVFEVSQEPVSD